MRFETLFLPLAAMFAVIACSAGGDDGGTGGLYCERDADCGNTEIFYCDLLANECRVKPGVDIDQGEGITDTGEINDSGGQQNDGEFPDDSGGLPPDFDYAGMECIPGTTEECSYSGPAEKKGVGACKAAVRVCKSDGTWSNCNGEVLPTFEVCNNGVDEDCDGIVDNGTDFDGDGWTYCDNPPDCCETENECPDPAAVWPGASEVPDGVDNNCDGTIDEGIYDCDTGLNLGTKDPYDYARSIGLCNGVIEAKITQTNGGVPNINSNALLPALGAVIKPKHGGSMLALSSGQAQNPPTNTNFQQGTSAPPPSDWYAANGNKYPSSPSCGGGTGTTGSANDNVMVTFKIQVPPSAHSFSFNIYFLTIEYPSYICTQYNDFFVALLDSGYNNNPTDPNLLNPFDKNLAVDDMKNPVGVNLAPNGLFKQCTNVSGSGWAVTSCQGTEELVGTGFEGHGGTGWLTVRGNVLPGEVITLRFAIWDLGDHILDSMVLIDNFQWQSKNFKPGTSES